jgi:hypothetical protein
VEDAVFDPTTFSKNRERLLNHLVAKLFFQAVLDEARRHHLLSIQHFTVDGTLRSLGPRSRAWRESRTWAVGGGRGAGDAAKVPRHRTAGAETQRCGKGRDR